MHHGPGVVGTVPFVSDGDADVELVIVGPDNQQVLLQRGHVQGDVRDALVLVPTVLGEGDLKRSRGVLQNQGPPPTKGHDILTQASPLL